MSDVLEHQSLFPYLSVDNAAAAMTFYAAAFGAEDRNVTLRVGGEFVVHAEMTIGKTSIFLAEAAADPTGASPLSLGNTPVRLALDVADVDAVMAKAAEHGAEVLIPAADQFYGCRAGRIRDPFGHVWIISARIEEISTEEMQRRMDAMMAKG